MQYRTIPLNTGCLRGILYLYPFTLTFIISGFLLIIIVFIYEYTYINIYIL